VFPPEGSRDRPRVRIFQPLQHGSLNRCRESVDWRRFLRSVRGPTVDAIPIRRPRTRPPRNRPGNTVGHSNGSRTPFRFAWMTQPISDIRAHRHRSVAVARGQSACTVRPFRRKLAGASRVLRVPFLYVPLRRARRSMRHPSSVGECAPLLRSVISRAPCIRIGSCHPPRR